MRLKAALETAIEHVEAGDHPNDALEKAAAEHEIPAGHIPLLVRGYNTGRTLAQHRAGASAREKAAEFPLADSDVVVGKLFPAEVEEPAAMERRAGVSPEYAMPPSWYAEDTRPAPDYTLPPLKAAEALRRPEPPAQPARPSLEKLAWAERMADEARAKARGAHREFSALVEKLAYALDKGPVPYVDARKVAEARWGDEAAELFDYVVGLRPRLAKRASAEEHPAFRADAEPYKFVPHIFDAARKARAALAEHEVKRAEARAIGEAREPKKPAPEPGFIDRVVAGEKQAFGPITSNLLSLSLRDGITRFTDRIGSPGYEDRVDTLTRRLSDPAHEQEIRDIRSRAMLSDMLQHDDVISGHSPEEVANAYNRISMLAPNVADNQLLVEGLLRKHLQQGALDTFEGNELVGTEQKLRDISRGAQGAGSKKNTEGGGGKPRS